MNHHFASQVTMEKNSMCACRSPRKISSIVLLASCLVALALGGCGVVSNPGTPASANKVFSYFGSPFSVSASDLPRSVSKFDHSANQISASSFIHTMTGDVPSPILDGTFAIAPTGFLKITENFASGNSGFSAQNPPLTGAWAVEIPGAGALGNLLSLGSSVGLNVSAAPVAIAQNTVCPNFSTPAPFLYVTVPTPSLVSDIADYGGVNISTQGAAVTFQAQPYLIGSSALAPSTVTGGCSDTYFGPLTAYPLNSFGAISNLELIAIGQSGFLVSSFTPGSTGSSPGAFGGGTGIVGFSAPSSPVDIAAVVAGQYNGFVYAPQNTATASYDITVLASAFGDHAGNSQACSTLQSSLAANNGKGANSVAALPSANSLYGGEFLTSSGSSAANDPTGANGSENCDVAIDLGVQDPVNNGLFPHATIFIGSNYPPFSSTNPWNCFGTALPCAVSFPAAAVVGKVQGQFVIFMVASAGSNPAAQLPNNPGSAIAQPVGIYLFQKMQ